MMWNLEEMKQNVGGMQGKTDQIATWNLLGDPDMTRMLGGEYR
jgi:hypothetical protein